MKKVYALLIGIFLSLTGFSQSCLPLGITFTTQAQIDNFQINYPNCTEIEGDVSIGESGGMTEITNLSGLSVLTSIGGNLAINNNYALTNLTGLKGLTSIGGNLAINNNYALTNLTELEGLASIGGDLSIYWNDPLTNLTGLEGLDSIGGDLSILWNESLTSLTGLEGLTSIGGYLSISDCDTLTSLTGLEGLTSIGGDLIIEFHSALTSLTGLDNITSIGGDLLIKYNYALNSLTGLERLTSIGGNLIIDDCDPLTSLTGLEGLTSIGGELKINWNESLTSLTGLENIVENSITDLRIINNDFLSTCDVKSVCDYLASPNGNIEISNNAIGCNSQVEVETACGLGLEDNTTPQTQITIYPNPSTTAITISLATTTPVDNTTLTIYNAIGRQVLSRSITEPQTVVNNNTLPGGVYFVRITTERTVMVSKFIRNVK